MANKAMLILCLLTFKSLTISVNLSCWGYRCSILTILNHFPLLVQKACLEYKRDNHKKGYNTCSLTEWNVLAHAKVISMIGGGIRPDRLRPASCLHPDHRLEIY